MPRGTETARASAPRTAASRARPAPAVEPPILEVTIRWAIAADALPERLRAGLPAAGDDALLELVIACAGGSPAASARLRIGGGEQAIDPGVGAGTAVWRREPQMGLEHIDLPGVVALTFRPSADGAAELLYARTPLLSQLGIAGGRYEASSIETVQK
jgi:hypothetical protein